MAPVGVFPDTDGCSGSAGDSRVDHRTDRSPGPHVDDDRTARNLWHPRGRGQGSRSADGAVGRPHLAAELLEMGVVETFQQAFDDWIGDGAPANVERPRPTLAEASARVHAAGLLLLGSPRVLRRANRRVLDLLSSLGIEAVEAFHGGHTDAYRDEVACCGGTWIIGHGWIRPPWSRASPPPRTSAGPGCGRA